MSKPRELEIHAGHWDALNSGANGVLNEVKENRRFAKRIFEILQSNKVPSTYFEDNVSGNQRDNVNRIIAHHNKDKDGLIVSVHFNASGTKTSRPIGTEVLYSTQKELAAELSKAISDATGGGLLNRGAKYRKDLGILSRTYEPAVLIEVAFVNSTVDAAIYNRDFEKICQATAKVLAKAVGKNLTQGKVEDELTFSSPSLKNKVSTITSDKKLQQKVIKEGIKLEAFNASWQDKFVKGGIKDGDWIGLYILYLEKGGK